MRSKTYNHANSILVISYGGIGDILLTTPLIRSLKVRFPECSIDLYLQRGRAGILEGNPDIRCIFEAQERHGTGSYISFFSRFTQKYDVAVATRRSDRQVIFARAAGRKAYSMVTKKGSNAWWVKLLMNNSAEHDTCQHVAIDLLKLAELLDAPGITEPVLPFDRNSESRLESLLGKVRLEPFAVFHVTPRNVFKAWPIERWCSVAQHLNKKGIRTLVIGGTSEKEQEEARQLPEGVGSSAINLCGKTSLADAACLLSKAKLYMGLDTATTHLAAASHTKTVALYGRKLPMYWPYKGDLDKNPYCEQEPSHLVSGPVHVILGRCACDGGCACEKQPGEMSACMNSIDTPTVIGVVNQVL